MGFIRRLGAIIGLLFAAVLATIAVVAAAVIGAIVTLCGWVILVIGFLAAIVISAFTRRL